MTPMLLSPSRSIRALARSVIAALPVLLLAACSSEQTAASFEVDAADYARAFDAAKHALRDMRFDLERIDARNGVITSAPKETAGLATPWDREQSTFGQELEDLVQHQRRSVRITFEPAAPGLSAPPAPAGATPSPAQPVVIDLLEDPRPVTLKVRVGMERIYRPHWRVDSTSIRLNSYAWDNQLAEQGLEPEFATEFAEDPLLAARLAEKIRERMSAEQAAIPPLSPASSRERAAAPN